MPAKTNCKTGDNIPAAIIQPILLIFFIIIIDDIGKKISHHNY